jgi:uncharacterized protein
MVIPLADWLGNAGFWVYPIKTVVVAALLFAFRKHYFELRFRFDFVAIAVGIAVFVLWVGLDPYLPHFELKKFVLFESRQSWEIHTWMAFRILGMALVVPVFEELFWRSFLSRWIIDPNWTTVPLGKFTWGSFLIVALIFGFEHVQWASGIIAGLIYGGLLYWRKNLFSCVLAHATTNLLLGLYVIKTESWQFW